MNKLQAKKKVFDYFKKNAIEYKFVNEELKLIDVDSLDTIYLCASIPEVIGGHIETCIRFREEHLYCQSYYCQPVVHNEEEAVRAARLINYLNSHLKYECDILYNHVYILDEDNGDMVFTENLGTAKTTVARLFAEIMKDEKILSTGVLVEAGRADLVGEHVGATAPMVKKKFKEAEMNLAERICQMDKTKIATEVLTTIEESDIPAIPLETKRQIKKIGFAC